MESAIKCRKSVPNAILKKPFRILNYRERNSEGGTNRVKPTPTSSSEVTSVRGASSVLGNCSWLFGQLRLKEALPERLKKKITPSCRVFEALGGHAGKIGRRGRIEVGTIEEKVIRLNSARKDVGNPGDRLLEHEVEKAKQDQVNRFQHQTPGKVGREKSSTEPSSHMISNTIFSSCFPSFVKGKDSLMIKKQIGIISMFEEVVLKTADLILPQKLIEHHSDKHRTSRSLSKRIIAIWDRFFIAEGVVQIEDLRDEQLNQIITDFHSAKKVV
ncbi:unnamed protein product [Caenorhabditis sp. 36 PRJEB53466]|nr:unnamed protein product [Caenorhabditis sp. 36 PRJEB53466]